MHQRMSRSGARVVQSAICGFCGEEEEDMTHVVGRCPAWEHCRSELRRTLAERGVAFEDLLPVTQACGLVVEDPMVYAA